MSDSQERAVVSAARAALERDRGAVAVGLKVNSWDGPDSIALGDGRIASVVLSDSVLEVRDRLVGVTETERVVILTPLSEKELGADVMYRLAGRRIRPVGIWDPLMEAFAARRLDPRLRRRRDLAEALISSMPAQGYAKAPNGVLTMDHAWGELAAILFEGRPSSPSELIVSASQPASASRLQALPVELIKPLTERMVTEFGAAAGPILRASYAGHSNVLVALGIVAEIVYPSSGDGSSAISEARGALRTQWGGPVELAEGRAVAAAARDAFEEADAETRATWLNSANELVAALALEGETARSSVLPAGFDKRVEQAVAAIAETSSDAVVERTLGALVAVDAHRSSSDHPGRRERLLMALRLRLFLDEDDEEPGSLEEAADQQVIDGGWVDFARDVMRGGSGEPGLEKLLAHVDQRQTQRARWFAKRLADATAADSLTGVIGVETAIATRIAPLAQSHPTLVIVLDGLSEGAFRSLMRTIEPSGWVELGPDGESRPPMLAALPSVTKFSRTSLLSGELIQGNQKEEREGFDRALADIGEPRLFHKAQLASSLTEIEAEIASDRQVVGIVINAIDDMLDKGDQIKLEWSVDSIDPLRALLTACESAGRALVLVGDHGHVLEHGSTLRSIPGGGLRWRPAEAGGPDESEVLVRGRRVLAPHGVAVLAATEDIRYGQRSAGYHGGATPQEVVSPLVVLAPGDVDIPGWSPCARAEPGWWLLEEERISDQQPTSPDRLPREKDRPRLFEDLEGGERPTPAWIEALLASSQFTKPYEKAVRPPSRERIAEFLDALDARDNRAGEAAIARELGISSARVQGIVASLRSLLNIEGYQVLKYDQASGDIELDRDLLDKQFSP